MWVQQRNFFGQIVVAAVRQQRRAGLERASTTSRGSADLISIRGRAAYSRPFDRVEALRRDADAQFRAKEQQLETELQQTEETADQAADRAARRQRGHPVRRAGAARSNASSRRSCASARNCARSRPGSSSTSRRSACAMKIINILLVPLIVTALGAAGRAVAQAPAPCHRHAAQRGRGMNQQEIPDRSRRRRRVAAGAGVWLSLHRSNAAGRHRRRQRCSPISSPRSARSSEIRLSKGDGSRTTLRKAADGWTVVERAIPGRRRARARARAGPRQHEGRRTQDQRSG